MLSGPFHLDTIEQLPLLSKEEALPQIQHYQLLLLELQEKFQKSNYSLVILMEGPDAAGKGGAIKYLIESLDPRPIRVYSIAKPTEEELARHYLWRFWRRLPAKGQWVIFDRSWYGRVLVERVEGFAFQEEWQRAYREINELEHLLRDGNTLILKTFLMVSKEEQLRRFEERQNNPLKRWKINPEDWRNRAKWEQHNEAAAEMIAKTSTEIAPWQVIPADHKWSARLFFIRRVYELLAGVLNS